MDNDEPKVSIQLLQIRPAGHASLPDCVACVAWMPGSVVYLGNTLGACAKRRSTTPANATCERYEPLPASIWHG